MADTTTTQAPQLKEFYAGARRRPMARKWIAGAIGNPGALTRQAKQAGQSPMGYAREHQGAPGKTGQRSRLALRLRAMAKNRIGRSKG